MKNIPKITNKIFEQYEVEAINSRDLHKFLRIGRDYSSWIKDIIEKNRLVENMDYVLLPNIGEQRRIPKRGGHNRTDYIISIDVAKLICLSSNTKKGDLLRRNYINRDRKIIQNQKEKIQKLELEAKDKKGQYLGYHTQCLSYHRKRLGLEMSVLDMHKEMANQDILTNRQSPKWDVTETGESLGIVQNGLDACTYSDDVFDEMVNIMNFH